MNHVLSSDFFRVFELANGVYATIAKPGQGAWSNAGFIDLGDEVLVFDTCSTPKAARSLRNCVEELIEKPIKYVVNSHYHGDHVFGNQIFPNTTIIATPKTRELMMEKNKMKDVKTELAEMEQMLNGLRARLEKEQNPVTARSLTNQIEELTCVMECVPEMKTVLPNLLFQDNLIIHGSKRCVELHCFGGGHTQSDTFLYIPDCKVAFMGDIVARDSHFPIDNPESFVEILERIEQNFEMDHLVPGHGQIGDKECLKPVVRYLATLIEYVKTACDEGKTLEECININTPADFSTWSGVGGFKRSITSVFNYFQR